MPKGCLVNDCNRVHSGRGYCKTHYDKWLRHGDPLWEHHSGKMCSVVDCENQAISRGYCGRHYHRWRVYGSPIGGSRERHPEWTFERRFWYRVDTHGGVDACWEWTAARHYKGYGEIQIGTRHKDKAHRVAWRLSTGLEIPAHGAIMHTCDNPPCCNPRHLVLGTNAQNVADKVAKGRQLRGEQHPRAKLTRAIVEELRRRYNPAERVYITTLARAYGISTRHISGIIRGESWR